jgi:hypothetical protein
MKKILLSATLLLVAAAAPFSHAFAAVSSTVAPISGTAWTDLGPGPLTLGVDGSDTVVYLVGDTSPVASLGQGVPIDPKGSLVQTGSHIWVSPRIFGATPRVISIPVAVSVSGGGGGGGVVSQGPRDSTAQNWWIDTQAGSRLENALAAGAGKVLQTWPAPTTDGSSIGLSTDKRGRTITVPHAPRDLTLTVTATSSAGPTALVAADASNIIVVTHVECDTQVAAAAAGLVVIQDSAGTPNVMARLGMPNGGNGSAHETSSNWWGWTAAVNQTVNMVVTGGQSTTCIAKYFKVPS